MNFNDKFNIVFDELSEYLDSKDPLLLKEDMLQLQYGRCIIDVGFYQNEFVLYVIEDNDWDSPYLRNEIDDLIHLIPEIENACKIVLSLH